MIAQAGYSSSAFRHSQAGAHQGRVRSHTVGRTERYQVYTTRTKTENKIQMARVAVNRERDPRAAGLRDGRDEPRCTRARCIVRTGRKEALRNVVLLMLMRQTARDCRARVYSDAGDRAGKRRLGQASTGPGRPRCLACDSSLLGC